MEPNLIAIKPKGKAFKIGRNGANTVLLPPSAVEEVRALSRETANATVALSHTLLGKHTKLNVLLKSDLHFRAIQSKLTPNLASLAAPVEEEINWSMRVIPDCDDWTVIKPYHPILEIVAGVSARTFVGLPLCRDSTWLEASMEFTENSE